jgi:hypothetical protein
LLAAVDDTVEIEQRDIKLLSKRPVGAVHDSSDLPRASVLRAALAACSARV